VDINKLIVCLILLGAAEINADSYSYHLNNYMDTPIQVSVQGGREPYTGWITVPAGEPMGKGGRFPAGKTIDVNFCIDNIKVKNINGSELKVSVQNVRINNPDAYEKITSSLKTVGRNNTGIVGKKGTNCGFLTVLILPDKDNNLSVLVAGE
jgi:hypothetical protein